MYGRYAFSIVIGVVVTMSLLFLMQVLIATGKQALTKPRDRAQAGIRPRQAQRGTEHRGLHARETAETA